ncbi:MAG: nickel pincer cofactor biosynthesis protein LarC [bacterium]|uniref:Putative nickel insertion protein n=2 Tax=Candidatus Infernicultor aquiphilus TaxID=1805029 RepID=A0A1J5GJT8_9BACT|nr:nickel pincer cofactor biosynthesis protein LarC [bacterium]OIP72532.1 MAG: TIGR00299 family protein [Candidatus Atribacteria bacterium CG2_30_33_13]PIU24822.1 MAG: TIGR00299 family protein [Candidatus Atribacteria bacterium CG08_land_8_20_14_0_20_33_29]PIW11711.1 MAG: TIGR00299 family protein [Candidatus Atribacteria bacterium CG17_big_fil_post_rev_8_21_14_2_50_34_11]PIX33625.1 MAG: TIGR00299 family protein [Candidatus Atribacteria bacterium CG_4_8_14_3_um_filter_34_18]PJB58105.1 MAG: TIGR
MRIAYFDCFSGISGDMFVGALLDAGLKIEILEKELNKLNLSGYQLEVNKVLKKGISASQFKVKIQEKGVERRFKDILNILEESKLDEEIKNEVKKIFFKIAEAESKIHQEDIEKIHFHEIGGLDSIMDISSAVIGIKALEIKEIYSSPLPLGQGLDQCAHGILPLPAPATLELLKNIPTYSGGMESEMVTPTGAAIISTLTKDFGERPLMKIEKIGYGAGEREFSIPNLLRVSIGEKILRDRDLMDGYVHDEALLIETNIDDMNPEFYNYIMDELFSQGALDVFLTPIQMKKNRPAQMLSIIVYEQNLKEILEVLFSESTTLGVRIKEVKRLKLTQANFIAETKYGKIKVKVGVFKEDIKTIAPEYQDCQKIAQQYQVPLKEIYEEAKKVAYDKLGLR